MSDKPVTAEEFVTRLMKLKAEWDLTGEAIVQARNQFHEKTVVRNRLLASMIHLTSEERSTRVHEALWAWAMQDGEFAGVLWDLEGQCYLHGQELENGIGRFQTLTEARNQAIRNLHAASEAAKAKIAELTERLKEHALHNTEVREAVWAITDGKCFYCEIELTRCVETDLDRARCFHIDHLVPKTSGGPDHLSNYVPACGRCNISKGAKSYIEFLAWRRAQQPQLTVIDGGAVA